MQWGTAKAIFPASRMAYCTSQSWELSIQVMKTARKKIITAAAIECQTFRLLIGTCTSVMSDDDVSYIGENGDKGYFHFGFLPCLSCLCYDKDGDSHPKNRKQCRPSLAEDSPVHFVRHGVRRDVLRAGRWKFVVNDEVDEVLWHVKQHRESEAKREVTGEI